MDWKKVINMADDFCNDGSSLIHRAFSHCPLDEQKVCTLAQCGFAICCSELLDEVKPKYVAVARQIS